MKTNLIQCWLENLLDIHIDYNKLQKDHVTIVNLIINIFEKCNLIDSNTQKFIQNATCLEDKLTILQPHLKSFGEIDQRSLTCIKCGNIERLKNILQQMYLELAPNPSYKYKKLKNYQGKVCIAGPSKKFTKCGKYKSIEKGSKVEERHQTKKNHSKAQQLKICEDSKDKVPLSAYKLRPKSFDPNTLQILRRALEESYTFLRCRYNAIQKAELRGVKHLFHGIFDIGIYLAVESVMYKSSCDTQIPDNILSEWTSLLINRHKLYDLPLYETPEDLECPKLIEVDELGEKVISELSTQQYLCSQGAWTSPDTIKSGNESAVDKFLNCLKYMSQDSTSIDPNSFSIRAIMQTNMVEKEKEKFLNLLNSELESLRIVIIEPQSLFENAIGELVADPCNTQDDDDGFCELVHVLSEIDNDTKNLSTTNTSTTSNPKSKGKKKSSLKRSTAENEKSRKSVTISSITQTGNDRNQEEPDQTKHETHICQTPLAWTLKPSTKVTSYLQIMSSVIQEDQLFDQLPLKMKVDFLVRHLEDLSLKDFKGFFLVDFPTTLEEIDALETALVRQTPSLIKYSFFQSERFNTCESTKRMTQQKSFFTHYFRLKNYNELYNGLYFDEINIEDFTAIKKFYSNLGTYHTLEYYNIQQDQLLFEITQKLKDTRSSSDQILNKDYTKYAPRTFIRTQVSLEKADVELQIDILDCEPDGILDDTENLNQNIESWKNTPSKFFVEEKVQKWKFMQNKYEKTITNPLFTRSNILRDYFSLQRYIEAASNFNVTQTIDDSVILETFEEKFSELGLYYRKDEEGICYLYSLVDDLSNQLTVSIKEKQNRNLILLNCIWEDRAVTDMTVLIVNCSKWLLYQEAQRFIDAMRFIIELFSFLLHQEISIAIPDINCPEDISLLKKKSNSSINTCSSEVSSKTSNKGSLLQQISVHDDNSMASNQNSIASQLRSRTEQVSEIESDIPEIDYISHRMPQYTDSKHDVRLKVDNYCTMIQDVAQQIYDHLDTFSRSISSTSSKQSKAASIKTKRRLSSDTASVISQRSRKSIKRSKKWQSNLPTIASVDTKTISSTESKKSRRSMKQKISTSTVESTYASVDQIQEQTEDLKNQLRKCIQEQFDLTKHAFNKIETTLDKDLTLLLLDHAESLQNIDHRIRECQEFELGQVKSLVNNLSNGIENTWKSVEICKCNGNYYVEGTPFIFPSPSLESLSPEQRLLNQLCDIKFLIKEFQIANSHSYHISYHQMMQILRTSLIKLCFMGNNQLYSSVESIQTVLNQLKQVSDNSFIVDWRDLILNLINMRHPSLDELLGMKEMFEQKSAVKNLKWVSLGNYCQIKLWFEHVCDIEIACELKGIFFELYKKGENSFWYESFLLGLCKSKNPIEGFNMALQLCSGKSINESHELGEEYLQVMKNQAKLKDFIKDEMEQLSRNICCKILYSDDFTLLNQDSTLTSFIRSESLIIEKPRVFDSADQKIPRCSTKTSIMTTVADDSLECIEQRCQLPQKPLTPVKRYLQLRKLHSCGCPVKEIDFESLSLSKNINNETEYCINKSVVLYVLEQAFPWHKDYKTDGYDLIDAINSIFDELSQEMRGIIQNVEHKQDPSIPAHKLFEHGFIRHWISNGLTFTNLSLVSSDDQPNSK